MKMRRVIVGFGIVALVGCKTAAAPAFPLEHTPNRPTPLSFGLYVTPDPAQNPIDPPERFTGYHAAVDYEVSTEEVDRDVPVYALCSGKVVYSGFASGYGGLLVHRCRLQGEDVTVIYGHLALANLPAVGKTVKKGQKIGLLAPARSTESDGNRKHLHLGIHRGRDVDVRGYVQHEDELSEYIDPASVLPASIEGVLPDMQPYWSASGSSIQTP